MTRHFYLGSHWWLIKNVWHPFCWLRLFLFFVSDQNFFLSFANLYFGIPRQIKVRNLQTSKSLLIDKNVLHPFCSLGFFGIFLLCLIKNWLIKKSLFCGFLNVTYLLYDRLLLRTIFNLLCVTVLYWDLVWKRMRFLAVTDHIKIK